MRLRQLSFIVILLGAAILTGLQTIPAANAARPAGSGATLAGGALRPINAATLPQASFQAQSASNKLPSDIAVPAPGGKTSAPAYNGVVGTQNAYMDLGPAIVSRSGAPVMVTMSSGWAPGETIHAFIDGNFSENYTAGPDGRLLRGYSSHGAAYSTFLYEGQTSGKTTGGVNGSSDANPLAPSIVAAPHTVSNNGSGYLTLAGSGWPVNLTLTIARNEAPIANATTDANGIFAVNVAVAAGPNTAAVYSAYVNTASVEVGVSVEERADAGTPQGDQNPARAYSQPALLNSAGGNRIIVASGFDPAENVAIDEGNGGLPIVTAVNHSGAIGLHIYSATCRSSVYTFTGQTTKRVARVGNQCSSRAPLNIPAALTAPETVRTGDPSVLFSWVNMPTNGTGTVYLDDTPMGDVALGTYSGVYVAVPYEVGMHALRLVTADGQVVVAPLLVQYGLPKPTATATPSSTPSSTRTATNTRTATATPSSTRTATATATATATGPASYCGAVSWTAATGVSVSGNTITKTGATGWNAGAISAQQIASGNGYVAATVYSSTDWLMFGLGNGNSSASYSDIEYAFYLNGSSSPNHLLIYEKGASKGTFGSYAVGDVLRVAVENGAVKYYRNGVLLYTSAVAPTYPLLLDSSLYNSGGRLANAQICNGLAATSTPTRTATVTRTATSTATLTRTATVIRTPTRTATLTRTSTPAPGDPAK